MICFHGYFGAIKSLSGGTMSSQAHIALNLKRVIYVVMLGLILIMNSSCYGRIDDQTKKSRAIVEKSAIWFIEEGAAEYYRSKDVELIKKQIEEFGGYIPTTEIVLTNSFGVLMEILIDDARYRLGCQAQRGIFQLGSKRFLCLSTPYAMCSNFLMQATSAQMGFLPFDRSRS